MAAMRSWARPCIGAGPWNEALVGGARRFFLCQLCARQASAMSRQAYGESRVIQPGGGELHAATTGRCRLRRSSDTGEAASVS